MPRRTVILDSAKEELRDIKRYVRKEFGESVWNAVNAEYKNSFRLIREDPQIGSYIDELKEIGIVNIRCVLVRQTRVIYEFDETLVLVHMLIATRRDFRTHLLRRLFAQ